MNFTRIFAAVSILAMCCVFSACSTRVVHTRGHKTVSKKEHGPPPHAPAHGYRHKHGDGVVLVYDSSLQVYVVHGHSNHFYHGKKYYRMHGNNWEASTRFKGPWHAVSVRKLPDKLQHTTHAKKTDSDRSASNDRGASQSEDEHASKDKSGASKHDNNGKNKKGNGKKDDKGKNKK